MGMSKPGFGQPVTCSPRLDLCMLTPGLFSLTCLCFMTKLDLAASFPGFLAWFRLSSSLTPETWTLTWKSHLILTLWLSYKALFPASFFYLLRLAALIRGGSFSLKPEEELKWANNLLRCLEICGPFYIYLPCDHKKTEGCARAQNVSASHRLLENCSHHPIKTLLT